MRRRLLYVDEAAELVGVTPSVIWKWVQRGKLSAFAVDGRGRHLYLCSDVYRAELATRNCGDALAKRLSRMSEQKP